MTDIKENKIAAKPERKEFDFDYWCRLAKENPDVFETMRKKEIDKYLANITVSETRDRMSKLQWRIEMERQRSKNPMDSAIRIYDMMWEAVGKNFEAIQDLADHFKPLAVVPSSTKAENKTKKAKVLKFQREEHTGTV